MKYEFWHDRYQITLLPYICLDFGDPRHKVILYFGWLHFGFWIKIGTKVHETGDF